VRERQDDGLGSSELPSQLRNASAVLRSDAGFYDEHGITTCDEADIRHEVDA
jgi:hypothetical protein